MTYQQYSSHLKVCEYLNVEPKKEYGRLRYKIDKLWENLESCIDSTEPDKVIFHKKGKFIFLIDPKLLDTVYLHHDTYSDFETHFYINGYDTTHLNSFVCEPIKFHLSLDVKHIHTMWFQRKVKPSVMVTDKIIQSPYLT